MIRLTKTFEHSLCDTVAPHRHPILLYFSVFNGIWWELYLLVNIVALSIANHTSSIDAVVVFAVFLITIDGTVEIVLAVVQIVRNTTILLGRFTMLRAYKRQENKSIIHNSLNLRPKVVCRSMQIVDVHRSSSERQRHSMKRKWNEHDECESEIIYLFLIVAVAAIHFELKFHPIRRTSESKRRWWMDWLHLIDFIAFGVDAGRSANN